ncbi:MAG TPA: ribosome maturation factor RimM [Pyrinomonadaceae bacterium]|nr:ribosome maturation factor RimM [Pyrinomonadaceae bacterium]
MSEAGNRRGAAGFGSSGGGDDEEELIAVARIVRVRGVRGEVAAHLLTDFPERFEGLTELFSIDAAGARRKLALEKSWLHGGRVVLKFAGYDSPEAAQVLVGLELAVPEAEAVELAEDEFYDWQLIDCRVETLDEREVGCVAEVLHTGAAPVLVVRDGTRENLIPLAASICVEIDTEAKLIRVDPPEGLLEI